MRRKIPALASARQPAVGERLVAGERQPLGFGHAALADLEDKVDAVAVAADDARADLRGKLPCSE